MMPASLDDRAPVPAAAGRPPRVAYLVSRFPKLTETFVLYELVALERMGVAIDLYPLRRERQPVAHPEAEGWVRRARFQPLVSLRVLRAQLHFLRHCPRRYLATLLEVLRRTLGSANFFLGALAYFPKAASFAYEMRRDGVSHVHAHFCNHPALAAFVIHRLTGIPYSFTAHGSDLHVQRRMLDAKVEDAAFAVTVSRFNRRVMLDACGAAAGPKIHVIHCGVDVESFAPRARAARDGPLRLVCVASFEAVKGHRYLVDACAILRDRRVGFVCDLVGDGPLRRAVQERIRYHRLDAQVRVLGGRPRPEVVRILGEADVAVLASRPTPEGKREGIPVALMEAMASGLPIVSTLLSGIPELVEDGRTGFLVPPADAGTLADALECLARDPDLRRRMGEAGRERVAREFDLRENAALLLRLVLDSAGAASAPGRVARAPALVPATAE